MEIKQILFIFLSIFFLKIFGSSCVVPVCSPQLSLYDITGVTPDETPNYFDWISTPSGALVAVATFNTGGIIIGVSIYTFDGTTLTLSNTIDYADEEAIQAISFLNDSGSYYLAIQHVDAGFFGSVLDIYSVTLSGIPTIAVSAPAGLGGKYMTWLEKLFIDGNGDRNYFLAMAGNPRVRVAQFNITQSTLTFTTIQSGVGSGYSVDWLISGTNQYLSAGLSGVAATTSNIAGYEFSAFPITSSGPNNVPVEASATDNGHVSWFTLGANNYLASAYTFGGSAWLKVSQFTPPTTFVVAPTCGIQLPFGATPESVSNVLIGGNNYITVGMSGVSDTVQVYRYDPSGGGSYCLAYEGKFGAVKDAKWITIGSKHYLGVVADNPTGCFNNSFHILELNYVPEAPTIDSPINNQLFCDPTTIPVSGTALGAACGMLQLSIDGGPFQTVVNNLPASGVFSFNQDVSGLSDGTHTLEIKSVVSFSPLAESPIVSVTIRIDRLAPSAPVITSPSSPLYCGPQSFNVIGTAEPLSQISLLVNGISVALGFADGLGNWSLDTGPLFEGIYAVTAVAFDSCSHESPPSNVLNIIITNVVPVPVINNASTCVYCGPGAFNITGTSQPTADITIYNTGVVFDTTTANGTGDWSISPVLGIGDYSFTAIATDDCARESAQSNTLCVVITAIVQPPIINNATECITCGPNPYTITGTNGVPNNTVTLFQDGIQSGQVTADDSGNWSYLTPSLSTGTYEFTATTTDNCSRTSAVSNALCVIISPTVVPPIILAPARCTQFMGGIIGINGTGPVSSPIYVYASGTLVATTATDASGNWTTTLTLPAPGIYYVSARALDDCMRLSVPSNTICFIAGQVSALVQAITRKYCALSL